MAWMLTWLPYKFSSFLHIEWNTYVEAVHSEKSSCGSSWRTGQSLGGLPYRRQLKILKFTGVNQNKILTGESMLILVKWQNNKCEDPGINGLTEQWVYLTALCLCIRVMFTYYVYVYAKKYLETGKSETASFFFFLTSLKSEPRHGIKYNSTSLLADPIFANLLTCYNRSVTHNEFLVHFQSFMDIWKHTNFIEKFESPDAVFPDEVEQDDPLILYTSVPSAVYIMPYFYFLSFFFLFGVSLFKMVPKYSTKVHVQCS